MLDRFKEMSESKTYRLDDGHSDKNCRRPWTNRRALLGLVIREYFQELRASPAYVDLCIYSRDRKGHNRIWSKWWRSHIVPKSLKAYRLSIPKTQCASAIATNTNIPYSWRRCRQKCHINDEYSRRLQYFVQIWHKTIVALPPWGLGLPLQQSRKV